MFTGIVEEIGTINNLVNSVLTIQAEKVLTDIKLGDSIAVNGTCLTASISLNLNFQWTWLQKPFEERLSGISI